MRGSILFIACAVLAACGEEALPPQPAPPPDRNFTATVNDQPVVGGTSQYECHLRDSGRNDGSQLYVLTFTDDLGHTIQIGLPRGDDQPGPRDIVRPMGTATGIAYGQASEAAAELTAIRSTKSHQVISGRFSIRFQVVNTAPGVTSREPLVVKDAVFEQVDCEDPKHAEENGE